MKNFSVLLLVVMLSLSLLQVAHAQDSTCQETDYTQLVNTHGMKGFRLGLSRAQFKHVCTHDGGTLVPGVTEVMACEVAGITYMSKYCDSRSCSLGVIYDLSDIRRLIGDDSLGPALFYTGLVSQFSRMYGWEHAVDTEDEGGMMTTWKFDNGYGVRVSILKIGPNLGIVHADVWNNGGF